MDKNYTTTVNEKATYRRLRKIIGYLGISLPIVLVGLSLIKAIFKTGIQESISHYYYTNLREIFTGTLCSVGLFLIRYKGFGNEKWWMNDNFLTNFAGAMAFGVALIPTNPICVYDKIYTLIPFNYTVLGYIHYGFAALLFLSFSLLSINVFTLGQQKNEDIPISILNENNIYKLCGYLIFLFIILIPVCKHLEIKYATIVFEALSLFAFGISWLVKGRALGDRGVVGLKLYREKNK